MVGRRPGGRLPYPGDTDHQPRRLLRLVANLHSAVYRAVHRQGNSISIQLAFCSARASQKKHCYLVKCRFLFCEHTHTVKCSTPATRRRLGSLLSAGDVRHVGCEVRYAAQVTCSGAAPSCTRNSGLHA